MVTLVPSMEAVLKGLLAAIQMVIVSSCKSKGSRMAKNIFDSTSRQRGILKLEIWEVSIDIEDCIEFL